MKNFLSIAMLFIIIFTNKPLLAQKYRSISSNVRFYSEAPLEDIEASTEEGRSAIDVSTNEAVFSIPIKSFSFEKSLMQEHFNENYMESDEYPDAKFRGELSGYDPSFKAWQKAIAKGEMNIHGEKQNISVEGEIKISDESIELKATFPIALRDYKIKIPKVVFYNIAEIVDVTITFRYEKIN